jgi:hypothetical protein
LIRVLEQQTCYRMHLMGKLIGARPYQTQLWLKVAHIFGDPKKIAHAIANIVYGGLMDSKSIGSKGEERFKSCKKKHNIMIGSFQDSHQPDKVNFFMPWQLDSISMQETSTHGSSHFQHGFQSRLSGHGWEA